MRQKKHKMTENNIFHEHLKLPLNTHLLDKLIKNVFYVIKCSILTMNRKTTSF